MSTNQPIESSESEFLRRVYEKWHNALKQYPRFKITTAHLLDHSSTTQTGDI
jgi:hypothetical protein